MLRTALIHLGENQLARRIATHAPGARTLTRRFVAGETVDDGVHATRALNEASLSVTLDYLGEAVSEGKDAEAAVLTYVRVLERIAAEGLDANVSLKLTQMGQDIDPSFLRDNVGRVLDLARSHDLFVRFDMESSAYTQATLDFFHGIWQEGYRNAGVALQACLFRSEQDVGFANGLGARVRLCKGAYKEPAAVAHQAKANVDANFVALMRLLLEGGRYPAIATHDEAVIRATTAFANERGIPSSAFEFQMLYGVRRDLQHQLRAQGYNVRLYVPFGEAWYPYLMRRMAERPANLAFFLNALGAESPLRFLHRRKDK